MSNINSLWQNDNTQKYNDYTWNSKDRFEKVKYDRPLKMRCRDSIMSRGALFFRKCKNLWSLVGIVKDIHFHDTTPEFVTLDIKKFGRRVSDQTFTNKQDIIEYFGFEFKNIGTNEKNFGLIPLIEKDETNGVWRDFIAAI